MVGFLRMWLLGILTQVLILAQQVPLPTEPSPGTPPPTHTHDLGRETALTELGKILTKHLYVKILISETRKESYS